MFFFVLLENSGCSNLRKRTRDCIFNSSLFMLHSEHGIKDDHVLGSELTKFDFEHGGWDLYGANLGEIRIHQGNFKKHCLFFFVCVCVCVCVCMR